MKAPGILRTAIALELIGLALGALSLLRLNAVSFMLFVGAGLPCLIAGAVMYGAFLVRRLRNGSAGA